MARRACLAACACAALAAACRDSAAAEFALAEDGRASVDVWCSADGREAAADLARVLEQISGARVEVREAGRPARDQAAVVMGSLAVEMGLPKPPKTISGDGYRVRLAGAHLLLAGETPESTFFATTHLLNELGCRWFFDNPIGTVIPKRATVTVGPLDVAEAPDFVSRNIWGPNWHGGREWKRRNRLGGIEMSTGHAWPRWFCTTGPEVQKDFVDRVVAAGTGKASVSISPPDGTGYCGCARCRALDDPAYREPSSGTVCVSDRFQEFYNLVGREVKKTLPDLILNHYAYADYSLPPRRVRDAPDNLCVWMAPIRFCRIHSMTNPRCPSRLRLRRVIEDWMRVESKMGYREYNYNLAELAVPFSKISIWREDIPWLHEQGCVGLNIESLAMWHIYGPNTYLVARLAWDADADVDAVMDDFYEKFCGAAAPHVKAYWERIDRAYRESRVHSGCFHGVHAAWTPEVLDACRADLDAALAAAGDELVRKRVEMFRMGLQSARHYSDLRAAWNRCDFVAAKGIYDRWLAHMDAVCAAGIHPVKEYARGYAPRFLGPGIAGGYERVTGGRELVVQLPDVWLFRYDPADEGEAKGWHRPALPSLDGWREVRTYSATLDEQGVAEELTWMWYRTTVKMPGRLPPGKLHLWLMELDGYETKVFLDGALAAEFPKVARSPVELEVTGRLVPGRAHTVVIKTNHRRISELMLGGILKPVMVYAGGSPAPPPAPGPAGRGR